MTFNTCRSTAKRNTQFPKENQNKIPQEAQADEAQPQTVPNRKQDVEEKAALKVFLYVLAAV